MQSITNRALTPLPTFLTRIRPVQGYRGIADKSRRLGDRVRARHSSSCFGFMAPMEYKDPFVFPPSSEHSATVFVLHGLGDTAHGWKDVAGREIWGRNLPHVKFVLPTAPIRAVTRNGGARMTAWFDIDSLRGDQRREDANGINETHRYLSELVEKEIQSGIPSERIVIAGYSQGGAAALNMLRSPLKFAGVLGMSCYLPRLPDAPIVSEQNRKTPVMMCHGLFDQTVPFPYGSKSFDILEKELENIQFKEYPISHQVNREELADTQQFLESLLPSSSTPGSV